MKPPNALLPSAIAMAIFAMSAKAGKPDDNELSPVPAAVAASPSAFVSDANEPPPRSFWNALNFVTSPPILFTKSHVSFILTKFPSAVPSVFKTCGSTLLRASPNLPIAHPIAFKRSAPKSRSPCNPAIKLSAKPAANGANASANLPIDVPIASQSTLSIKLEIASLTLPISLESHSQSTSMMPKLSNAATTPASPNAIAIYGCLDSNAKPFAKGLSFPIMPPINVRPLNPAIATATFTSPTPICFAVSGSIFLNASEMDFNPFGTLSLMKSAPILRRFSKKDTSPSPTFWANGASALQKSESAAFSSSQ